MYRTPPQPSTLVFTSAGNVVTAWSRREGRPAWAHEVPRIENQFVDRVRCVVAGDRVLVVALGPMQSGFFASPTGLTTVTCLFHDDGRVLWQTPMGPPINFGHFAPTLLIDDDLVLVTSAGLVFAVDLDDGRVRWESPVPGANTQNHHAIGLATRGGSAQADR